MPRKRQEDTISERQQLGILLKRVQETEDIDEIIQLTKHSNPTVRSQAIRSICPCKVYDKIDSFWQRILEMVDDEDDNVRYNVLHVLCDGSPDYLEDSIIRGVDKLNHDSNKDIRRRAHKVLGSYNKTGKWNVL